MPQQRWRFEGCQAFSQSTCQAISVGPLQRMISYNLTCALQNSQQKDNIASHSAFHSANIQLNNTQLSVSVPLKNLLQLIFRVSYPFFIPLAPNQLNIKTHRSQSHSSGSKKQTQIPNRISLSCTR